MKPSVAIIVTIALSTTLFACRPRFEPSETPQIGMRPQPEESLSALPVSEDQSLSAVEDTPATAPTRLSEEDVRAIVIDRFGDFYGERAVQAEVVDKGDMYEVTIPTKPREVPKGKLRYGPSFSLRIRMDAESGKILEACGGR